MKCTFLMCSPGTVLQDILKVPTIQARINRVIVDRPCGALTISESMGIPTACFSEKNNGRLSDAILRQLRKDNTDYLIVMFSRLLVGEILQEYRGRVLNFHPGLLPAFVGIGARKRAFESTVRFVGNTCHVVDETIDGGPIILQSVVPRSQEHRMILEHRLYVQHCKMVIQVIEWLEQGRYELNGSRVNIKESGFADLEFSPALDSPLAKQFSKEMPLPLQRAMLTAQVEADARSGDK